jgi:hypothetical protein
MRRTLGRAWLAMCIAALAAAAGCAGPQPTRLYRLTPLPAADVGLPENLRVGLRPVRLPGELDRPEIVTRTGEHTVALAEFDHWASPLAESFTRVLALDLAAWIPVERVAVFPWGKNTPIDYEVTVDVIRADGALGGACVLAAHWAVAARGARGTVAHGVFAHTEPAGESYAALVAAQSRLVAALAREIAAALRTAAR